MRHRFLIIGLCLVALAGCAESDENIPIAMETYPTEEECEQITGKECGFMMCDYVEDGQTFEQACGRGFKKGWGPINNGL